VNEKTWPTWSEPLTVGGGIRSVDDACAVLPALGEYELAECAAGLRPMTPDGPPILGLGRHRNLFFNSGHGHMGFTMACGSSRIVADLIDGKKPEIPLAGLTLTSRP